MKKHNEKSVISISFLAFLFLISACTNQLTPKQGVLEGYISIGPLCPVETDPPDPGCLPTAETYKAWPVSIWTTDGKHKISLITPSLDGYFSLEMEPGSYLVKLDKAGNGIGSSNLPVEISINSLETTVLNIDIDTGIR